MSDSVSTADLAQRATEIIAFNRDFVLQSINSLQANFREVLIREFFVIMGFLLYISFLVLSLIVYSPSYNGCIAYAGTAVQGTVIILHTVFISILVMYCFRSSMSADMGELHDFLAPKVLVFIVLGFFFVYGYLFFKCQDPTCTKDSPCESPDAATLYNSQVTAYVDLSQEISDLFTFYDQSTTLRRASVSSCSNFYNAAYRTAKDMGAANYTCSGANKTTSCIDDPDPNKGAPILSEFYIMTSNKTCVVNHQYDYYVSTRMIELALTNGARCLDFDLFPLTLAKTTIPIVTIALDAGNRNMQHNYVTFQQCLRVIVQNYYTVKSSDVPKEDPLFLHLNLHPGMSNNCMDQIAILLRYYFTEYSPNKLLGPEFNYRRINLGRVPICRLFGKVVILVRQVGYPDNYKKLTVGMQEVTNALAGVSIKDKDWLDIKNATNKEEFANFNRRHLTFVRANMHPYSGLSTEATTSSSSSIAASDSASALILNKMTINNDPAIPIHIGCQFVGMNFQIVDENLMRYLGFFERSSFILKPRVMRRKDLQYTEAIDGKYGRREGVSCDSESSDTNSAQMNDTFCKSVSSSSVVDAKSEDLKKSHETSKSNLDNTIKNPVFYKPGSG